MDRSLYSPQKTKLVAFGYVLLLLGLFVATYVSNPTTTNSLTFIAVGKALGVVTLTMLVGQMVFSSRITLLERGIGLDRLMLWHRRNAKIVLLLVMAHPFFVYYQPLMSLGLSFQQAIDGLQIGHYVGYAALLTLFVTVIFSITSERLRIPYHWWRVVHYFAYSIIVLGLVHGLFVSSAIQSRTWLFWWWVVLGVIVAALVVYRFLLRSHQNNVEYRVTRVVEETRDVRSIYLEPTGKQMTYAPGQFSFVRFSSEGLSKEEHHFTLSSSPLSGGLSFTIKELGDYTSQMDLVKPGDTAVLDGPYGVFSNHEMTGPFVFVAGGVGITPIMSMLRTMAKDGFSQKATLIYGNRTQTDVVFKHELEEMSQEFENFMLVHVYSAEEISGAEHGFVTKEILQKHLDGMESAHCFVCGPKPMAKNVITALKDIGVQKSNIYTELFSLK